MTGRPRVLGPEAMRCATVALALALCASVATSAPVACGDADSRSSDGWTLVWSDEFDGGEIDTQRWEHEVDARGGGNNELQYYLARPENSFVEDGKLVIRALAGSYAGAEGTREYTSARLRTKGRGDWLHGCFEIRARLPSGRGLWPAIWMLPTDEAYGGWAASGEIDIMELLGHEPGTVYGTLHYGGQWPDNVHTGTSLSLIEGSFADAFHVFSLEWEPQAFHWSVDGERYQTQSEWHTTGARYPAPFDRRFHLLLNVAVGGDWPGPPDESTVFPQSMEVDYVRVYARSNQPGIGG